ncbi:hypothetical protein WME89_28460 [Sorangium sp. So ce321]|uniref:hypothetical protein n=1 Tax=Sorangium sp. So ce321 TaxID=3133300 RepID=UPI003F630EE5
MQVTRLNVERFDIFIASEDLQDGVDYYYGGTRAVPYSTSDESVLDELHRLQRDESGLKNALINVALAQGALSAIDQALFPENFLGSRVGGARCILRPSDPGAAHTISNTRGDDLEATLATVFSTIGDHLNQRDGRIKLTPDFGRYAGLADLLYRHTPHVLGIKCDVGGCGGKSSYSTTGVVAAFEALGLHESGLPITLIGSAGAMGSDLVGYVRESGHSDVAVCDLAYDRAEDAVPAPAGMTHLPSEQGRFTREALARNGTIIATTVGRELENSSWGAIPKDTALLLAHNLAVPPGATGIQLMRSLQAQGVKAYPGQVLTLGGALTSRLEWFWRQSRPGQPFNKPLAHQVVSSVISYLVRRIEAECKYASATPIDVMYRIASEDPRTSAPRLKERNL